eukprot:SAG22_NODE_911_length_6541_cov_6.161285_4_plen_58_part_00
MTVCINFSNGDGGGHCADHAAVGVVMCDGFLLWRLPYLNYCRSGYCTAASGLFSENG